MLSIACDHLRAPAYYTASVENECSWKAYPCSNYGIFLLELCQKCNGECPTLGYDADETKMTGKHYLNTNSHEPFCGKLIFNSVKYCMCVCSFSFNFTELIIALYFKSPCMSKTLNT